MGELGTFFHYACEELIATQDSNTKLAQMTLGEFYESIGCTVIPVDAFTAFLVQSP